MAKVQIVGGNGGIGSAITEVLQLEGHNVEIISRDVEWVKSDSDILILNAGVGWFSGLENVPLERIEDMMYVNVERHIKIVRSVIGDWKKRKSGHLIFICSNSGYEGFPANNAYSATKGAILMFARSLMKELKPFQIKVSVVSPGTTNTDFWLDAGGDNRVKCIPVEPTEIANCVLFTINTDSMISELIILPRPTDDLSLMKK